MSFAARIAGLVFIPITNTYTTGTAATENVPPGAVSVTIKVSGGGASGNASSSPLGGGGGAECILTIAVVGGSLTYTVAASAIRRFGLGSNLPGNQGNASSVSGTVAGGTVNIIANGGDAPTAAGTGAAGGTGSGGNTNTPGSAGTSTTGGAGATPDGGSGGVIGGAGLAPGGGGGPAADNNSNSGAGARGQISFAYT